MLHPPFFFEARSGGCCCGALCPLTDVVHRAQSCGCCCGALCPLTDVVHRAQSCGTAGLLKYDFLTDLKSSILGVWAAPCTWETFQKDGGAAPPPPTFLEGIPAALAGRCRIDSLGSFKKVPGSFKRTPGSFKRTPGPCQRTPGSS